MLTVFFCDKEQTYTHRIAFVIFSSLTMSNGDSSDKTIIEKVAEDVTNIKLPIGGEFFRHFVVHERGMVFL